MALELDKITQMLVDYRRSVPLVAPDGLSIVKIRHYIKHMERNKGGDFMSLLIKLKTQLYEGTFCNIFCPFSNIWFLL